MSNTSYQRANVIAVDPDHGQVQVSMLIGPTMTIPFFGNPPFIGDLVWLLEVVPSAFVCLGTPGKTRTPTIRCYLAGVQAIPTATVTNVLLDTVDFYSGVPATTRDSTGATTSTLVPASGQLYFPWGGLWHVTGRVAYAEPNTTGRREAYITSGALGQLDGALATPNAGFDSLSVSVTEAFTTADYINLQTVQSSGVNASLLNQPDFTWLEMTWLGHAS